MEKLSIIITEDDNWYAEFIKHAISLTGDYNIQIVGTAEQLMKKLNTQPDIVTLDFNLPDAKGEKILEQIKIKCPESKVVIISGQEDVQIAVNLLSKGAFDYVVKNDESRNRIFQIMRNIKENHGLKKQIVELEREVRAKYSFKDILISNSKKFDGIYNLIEKASTSNINVSVFGATGTGKELVARAIHFNSNRAKDPFVAVNLSALSESLLESELFGYVKGAFTGANEDRKGKFEESGKGTIFLDEIAEINEGIQVKLLRVLQEMEISRVGSSKVISINCRIISATNKDLAEEVRKGNFRQDLYYRLMGLSIHLPKLMERDNDILVLAHHFSADYTKKNNLGRRVLSEEATNKLIAYHYPGNIRELKSIIDLACVLSDNGTIESEHIIFNDLSNGYVEMSDLDLTLKDRNKRLIENMLDRHNNNVRLVAKKLGIGKSTIYRLLK